MNSRYGVSWRNTDGSRIPLEEVPEVALRQAQREMIPGGRKDQVAIAMLDAICDELLRRAREEAGQ